MKIQESSACLFGKRENGSRRAFIEITNVCNMYCQHCMNNSGEQLCEGLPVEQLRILLNEMKEQQIVHLYISGGEPLLYNGIDEILKYAFDLGMKVTLATNGLEIEKHIMAIKSYVDTVSLSLDGIGETHDDFRGVKGAYKNFVRALEQLQCAGIKTRISSIIWKQNLNELEEMVNTVKKRGVKKINFNILVPVGRAGINPHIHIPVVEYKKVYEKVSELINKYEDDAFKVEIKRRQKLTELSERCPGGKTMFHINALGKVAPCSWLSKVDEKAEFSRYWKEGEFGKCIEACEKIEHIIEDRAAEYGYSGCPALAYIYNGSFLSEDPLNEMIEE